MTSVDAGAKYRGLSLEAEYYWRLVDNVRGFNADGLGEFRDHGFQVQASAMVVPKLVQVYVGAAEDLRGVRRSVGIPSGRELVPVPERSDPLESPVDPAEQVPGGKPLPSRTP